MDKYNKDRPKMAVTFSLISNSLRPVARQKIQNITYVYVDEVDTSPPIVTDATISESTVSNKFVPKTERVAQYGMHLITAWLSLCVVLFIPVHFIADRLMPK